MPVRHIFSSSKVLRHMILFEMKCRLHEGFSILGSDFKRTLEFNPELFLSLQLYLIKV